MIHDVAVRWLTRTDLPPDVFAVVMATGIVSVAAADHGYRIISDALAVLATLAFALLALGLVVRVIARPRSALGEVTDPDVAFRLFTSVAACAVLGARFATHGWAVLLFGVLALAGWLVLAPLALRDVRSRPRAELRDHAHGAWLLPSVATAGLGVTAADLAIHSRSAALLTVGAVAWLLGLLVYGAVTWLIAWRALAAPLAPDQVTPDSWILMGALAIGALAGAHLVAAARLLAVPGYGWARPLTVAIWIGAAVWIPPLLYAELWSVDQRIGALHYTRVWWSAVFPLGMFSAASAATGAELGIRALSTVSLVFFWVAVTVWLLVGTGLLHRAHAGRRARARRRAHAGRRSGATR